MIDRFQICKTRVRKDPVSVATCCICIDASANVYSQKDIHNGTRRRMNECMSNDDRNRKVKMYCISNHSNITVSIYQRFTTASKAFQLRLRDLGLKQKKKTTMS